MDHNAAASKDRTSMFDGQIFKITKKTGEQIMEWLKGAKPIDKPAAKAPVPDNSGPDGLPADDSEASEQPSDADEGDGQELVAIKPSQMKNIMAGIDGIVKRGYQEETAWKGIHKVVMEQHKRDFAELGELTDIEGATVIEYLKAWADAFDKNKAKAAARA
jgi:hypothetical protein